MAHERSYTVYGSQGEVHYSGFDRDFSPSRLTDVVITSVDGELDLWAVESADKTDSLMAYLREHEDGTVRIVGAYRRWRVPEITEGTGNDAN